MPAVVVRMRRRRDAACRRDGDAVFGKVKAFDVGRAVGCDQHLIRFDRTILAITRDG